MKYWYFQDPHVKYTAYRVLLIEKLEGFLYRPSRDIKTRKSPLGIRADYMKDVIIHSNFLMTVSHSHKKWIDDDYETQFIDKWNIHFSWIYFSGECWKLCVVWARKKKSESYCGRVEEKGMGK